MIKNKLMQLFNDNKSKTKAIKLEQDGDEATVYLYDAIGDWYGVEAQSFVKELAAIDAKTVHLRINSPGGDVFEGKAISTAIRQMKCKTIAHIDGLCASAATGVALACDEVEMAEGSFFMIHNAWTLAIGNAKDLQETADLLLKVDDSIVNDYAKKTGLDAKELKQMMTDETWFSAQEAKDKGFIDSIYEGEEVAALWNVGAYDNVPKDYLDKAKSSVANNTDICYARDRFERRLSLMELV